MMEDIERAFLDSLAAIRACQRQLLHALDEHATADAKFREDIDDAGDDGPLPIQSLKQYVRTRAAADAVLADMCSVLERHEGAAERLIVGLRERMAATARAIAELKAERPDQGEEWRGDDLPPNEGKV